MDIIKKIKEKDMVTYSHSLNVSKLCYQFSLFLGKPQEYAELMRVAGLFHDAGKLMIPDEILNKPSRLTEDEFVVMKSHALNGAMFFLNDMPEIVRNVAYGHHLSYVGGGYPDANISGDEIPLEARIAAVCDVYEALTAKRQYKEGKTTEEAITIMNQMNSLDPTLRASFTEMLMEGKKC